MAPPSGSTAPARKAQPPQPRISGRDLVFATVLVGPGKVRFVVHENLFVHYSKFFRAALTGGFKEAVDKVGTLEDTEPILFEFFFHWLYYQRLPNSIVADDENFVKLWMGDNFGTDQCIKLHIFGDTFDIEKLQLDTIHQIY